MQRYEQRKMKFSIEDDKQSIQYYEYLRNIVEMTEFSYWIGNPSVQIISGRIRLQPMIPIKTNKQPQNYALYLQQIKKSNILESQQTTQIKLQQKNSDMSNNSEIKQINNQVKNKKTLKSRCLVICGIPNNKSPVQVMQTPIILRNSYLIKQIRVIKTVHIKYYGMLILIENIQQASQFFDQLFGLQYNDLEIQRIIIRQIKQISLSFSQLNSQMSNQMSLLRQLKNQNNCQFVQPENIFMTYHYRRKKNIKQMNTQDSPNSQLICAICFEQCQKQTISILCGHYFDLDCLQKWSENICPLCRYHQQPPIIKFCQKCNHCQGLWICLICGSRLCCGGNNDILGDDSHIYDHFKNTGHSLSMQIQTKFLFDAKIPAFLHQKFYKDLIVSNRNSSNIQIIQEQKQQNSDNKKKNKVSQQIKQYELQVSQQMKRQRIYFEQQININVKQHRNILSKKRALIQSLRSQNDIIKNQLKQTQSIIQKSNQFYEKKNKQLQIIMNLIKMKQNKFNQNKNYYNEYQQNKLIKLKQLEEQIKEKRQEILNYRKNLKFKQKINQKLKNQQIQGQIVMGNFQNLNKISNQQKKKKK